jgi:hypothetical protein
MDLRASSPADQTRAQHTGAIAGPSAPCFCDILGQYGRNGVQQYQLLSAKCPLMCCERTSTGPGIAQSRRHESPKNGPCRRRQNRVSRSIPLFLVLIVAACLHIDVTVDVNAGLMHFGRRVQRCCSDILGQYGRNGVQQYQLLSTKCPLMCCE